MCTTCRWEELIDAIDADLELRIVGHTALLLATMADIVRANEHVTPEQRDAAESVLEGRVGCDS